MTSVKDNDQYIIRIVDYSDFDQIVKCLNSVVETLDDSEIFVAPSPAYIHTILSGYGKMAGIFTNNHLVGFASIVFPRRGKNNLGHYLGINSETLLTVAQLEHFCVVPAYRGKGLAKKIIDFLLADLPSQYTILLSTVSPKNNQSLSIAFNRRQRIVSFINIYGKDRYVMCCFLKDNTDYKYTQRVMVKSINMGEITRLLKLGYIGISFDKTNSSILFVKEDRTHETIPD